MPLEEAFRIVDHIVSKGSWPTDARWGGRSLTEQTIVGSAPYSYL
ncbi:hypothetical protein ACF08N_15915 [Streptomyces sp. NPDC015127]